MAWSSRLDSFLKRHTEREVYERFRASEPCVVESDSVRRSYMHVVLSDERVYVTEYPPRALTEAVSFSRVRDIELVNDLPEFLSERDRKRCQHIRITYRPAKPAGKSREEQLTAPHGPEENRWRVPPQREREREQARSHTHTTPQKELLTFITPPVSPTSPFSPSDWSANDAPESGQVRRGRRRRKGSMLTHLPRNGEKSRERHNDEEEGEAELHLYVVSQASIFFLHLQSCWNRFIIRCTLSLDPLSRSSSVPVAPLSCERAVQRWSQLCVRLLQAAPGLDGVLLVRLKELQAAARSSLMMKRLFWRSAELFVFLVQTLEDLQTHDTLQHTHQLLLRTAIVQTLAVMFTEMELQPSTLSVLTANRGSVASRMLMALICDPHEPGTCGAPQLQLVLSEYLDSACCLLSEFLLLGHQACRCLSAGNILTVGWVLRALHPHPHLLSFIGYQAERLVSSLSDVRPSVLSPAQAVLLFERCRLLLVCLQHSSQLAQHLRAHYTEEFRYYVTLRHGEQKLALCYPVSRAALRSLQGVLGLMLLH